MMKQVYAVFLCLVYIVNSQAQSSGPNTGTTTVNETVAGSAGNWTSLGNSTSSDNAYVTGPVLPSNGDYTDRFKITGFGFAIPVTATIQGIEVRVERSVTGGSNINDYEIFLVKNGITQTATNLASSTTWPTTDATVVYGSPTNMWGNTWTPADINNTGFGFAISAKRFQTPTGNNRQPRIDLVTITVHWINPIPVILKDFKAQAVNENKVQLSWLTLTEINTDRFVVEHSTDGQYFSSKLSVAARGNSTTQQFYRLTDHTPVNGINFYRLKEIAISGETAIFETRGIHIGRGNITLLFFGNTSVSRIVLNDLPAFTGNLQLELFNMQGQRVLGKQVAVNDATLVGPLNLHNLTAGNYLLRWRAGEKTGSTTFTLMNQ
jgi:hypothetical protein